VNRGHFSNILQTNLERAFSSFYAFLNRFDIAFTLKDIGNRSLDARTGNGHLFVTHMVRVTDAGEKIADRVSKHNVGYYQLDLVTPGISPRFAISRKQMRQSPKMRMNPCVRPQRQQRRMTRLENFGLRRDLAI
jgi:DNA replicative helicase MCM subunit Mcm2 (Cdc46/Mcm family)